MKNTLYGILNIFNKITLGVSAYLLMMQLIIAIRILQNISLFKVVIQYCFLSCSIAYYFMLSFTSWLCNSSSLSASVLQFELSNIHISQVINSFKVVIQYRFLSCSITDYLVLFFTKILPDFWRTKLAFEHDLITIRARNRLKRASKIPLTGLRKWRVTFLSPGWRRIGDERSLMPHEP